MFQTVWRILEPTGRGVKQFASLSRRGGGPILSDTRWQPAAPFAVTPDTSIEPFWLRTSTLPSTFASTTGAYDVRTSAGPLTAEARTAPFAFSTERLPTRSACARPKLVFTATAPPASLTATSPFLSTTLTSFAALRTSTRP